MSIHPVSLDPGGEHDSNPNGQRGGGDQTDARGAQRLFQKR